MLTLRRFGPVAVVAGAVLLTAAAVPSRTAVAQPPAAPAANSDWPYYGHDPGGMRYVDVDQISPDNVSRLRPAWTLHTGVANARTSFEAQPIVVGGRMYVSSPLDHVFAIDPVTGRVKWTYTPSDMPPVGKLALCCGIVNRGVAVGGGAVFVDRLDDVLVALDAETGKPRWKARIDDWQAKWSGTMAPLYVDGKVIVGSSGGELMKRGHVDAYDARTGRRLWRFFTVPSTGQPANETWAGNSWSSGGGTVWTTPVADPALGLLYITTGNASPDVNGSRRRGQNLFTDSIVALDLSTGVYRWHFQEVHHDLWDYDAAQPAHLFSYVGASGDIPAIGHANKDGYYFVLDRRNGRPLLPVKELAVTTTPSWQNPWPTQPTTPVLLIPTSLPKLMDVMHPRGMDPADEFTPPQGVTRIMQPGFESGPEWGAGAYSPRTRFAYVPGGGFEPWVYRANPQLTDTLGSSGNAAKAPGMPTYGLFDAVDVVNQKLAWQIRTPHKVVSGVAVAGNLVFFGQSGGQFNALDARSGKILWHWTSNAAGFGGANGSPAVYVANGREYVVMAFGGNVRERLDSPSPSSPPGDALVAFALPDGSAAARVTYAQPGPVALGMPKLLPAAASAPPNATVVTLQTDQGNYHPNHFTVPPGALVAVHVVNPGIMPGGFAITLPSGAIGLQGMVKHGKDAYFVFTAPQRPGNYAFFNPLGAMKDFGMVGRMVVRP